MMEFRDPWILFAILPCAVFLYILYRNKKHPSFRFSSIEILKPLPGSWKVKVRQWFFILRIICIILFLIALAGPRRILQTVHYHTQGMDIVLALDVSGSMAAEDFKIANRRQNRLEVVKEIAKEFIQLRDHDRIGIVAFAGFAYTASPLTLDQQWALSNLERLRLGIMEDGTAIGSAIASSVSRLKDSTTKSKVIILLTDGVNNAGKIDPLAATEMAAALGIRIYTIGVGTKGPVPFPVQDLWGRTIYQNVNIDFDEELLKKIADRTTGRYFWAKDTEALRAIYQEIDQLEKTDIEQAGYREYQQLFSFFLLPALVLLAADLLLSHTVFLRIP